MEGKISKKELTALVIGIISLVVLTFGATFAYFSTTVTDASGTTTIIGDIGGATLGTVTLSGGDTELYLGLSMYDMSENKKGTTYYSSTTEGSRETSKASAGKTTYTSTLSGDTTNTVMYACDYEFTVSASGTMLGKTSTKDVSVVFEGDINKTIPLSASQTVSGTWYGIKESNKERSFNAYLQFTNTENEQNDLVGTYVSIEIENTKWECHLSDVNELVGEAYAIYTEGNQTLTFLRSETPISVGGTHNGETITAVYTGFEHERYGGKSGLPWFDIYPSVSGSNTSINTVIIEDEIRPVSTAYWFMDMAGLHEFLGSEKLNTSLVTNMSHMFKGVTPNYLDLSAWDTSNVTDMSSMFNSFTVTDMSDLSNWDTSNVTNMSGMFEYASITTDIGIENWNVSNVTNMSLMFRNSAINFNIKLSDWNVSNVTNMYWMFRSSKINIDLDLSGWDVSKVENYEDFDFKMWGGGNLTPPNFG